MTVLVIVLAAWALAATGLAVAFARTERARRPWRGRTTEGLELSRVAEDVTREHYRDR